MKKFNAGFYAGIALAVLVIAGSVISLFYTPQSINSVSADMFAAPSAQHLLGTDNLGRDTLSRLMVGGRYTLIVAAATVALSAAVGIILGLSAGYLGGVYSEILMRLMDALSSFPGILLTVVAVSVMTYGKYSLILALAVLFVPSYTRIARTGALEMRGADFVKNLKILGASRTRIALLHILPNIAPGLLSATVIGLSNAILAEASMSYLGFGIQPPAPSWGRMLAESQNYVFRDPLLAVIPGVTIMITVIAFHLVGEGLRARADGGAK